MPKKNPDFVAQTIGFDFGEAGTYDVAISELPDEIVANLAVHGLSQKLGDSYAGAKAATEELDVDADTWARMQVESVFDQLSQGNWTTRTPGSTQVTDLARAIATVMDDVTEADAAEKLSEASKEEKAALRKHPAIKAELDKIRLARQAAKAEASAAAATDAPPIEF
jgi:acyl carrier protein phosphodiesterase